MEKKKMNKKITTLLPIHKLGEKEVTMLKNALTSVEEFHNDVKIMIISPSDVYNKLIDFDFGEKLEVELLENKSGNNDFTKQINLGIDNCKTEWFSILEIDDEYKPIWLKSMYHYIETYPDVPVFLPIIKDIDTEGKFLSFTNESVWAYGFSDVQGYITNEILLEYENYQTSGGLYKTQVIIDNGKFKDNIKLTFSYEFLLRLTHNGVKILVIPRAGYQHVTFREDSLFWLYKNDDEYKLDGDEPKFWLETAKTEFYYKNKRDIKIENS